MVLGNLYVPRYHFAYAAQPTPAQLDKQMAFCLDASHCLVALRDYCRKHWRAATRWADDQPMAVLYQPGPDVADLAAAVRQDFAQRPTPQRQLQGGHLNTANGRSLAMGRTRPLLTRTSSAALTPRSSNWPPSSGAAPL